MPLSSLHQLPSGILSSLPEDLRSSDYDRLARGYDAIVGNPIYNKAIWGCSVQHYRVAAERFLRQTGGDRLLDFGCGSLVFTAQAYSKAVNRLTLFDRSLGMLERGKKRLAHGHFVQGDAFNPPFPQHSFDGVMSWGMLHVFGTASGYLERLADMAQPEADIAISTLVQGERVIGDWMLKMLYARGEIARPEDAETVQASFARYFLPTAAYTIGSMLFLSGKKRGECHVA